MSEAETLKFLEYACAIYPSARMTPDQLKKMAVIWAGELSAEDPKRVFNAFKAARAESPIFMPSLPQIQMHLLEQPREKTAEELFRDEHFGKSQSEWATLEAWERSKDGSEAIKRYTKQLNELLGL